jgi:chromate transporter
MEIIYEVRGNTFRREQKKMSAMINRRLFLSFLRLGLTAFGGPAMIAHVKELSVKKNKWVDEETFKHGIALCQTIPGATVMQMVAYVGMKVNGIQGALVSYISFGLPAFLLMLIFSAGYASSHNLPKIVSLFAGLQVIVVAIIANATITFSKDIVRKPKSLAVACLSFVLLWVGCNPFLVVVIAAGISILLFKEIVPASALAAPAKPNKSPLRGAITLLVILTISIAVLYFTNRELFTLAYLMLKVDLFAFGGGFGSVPLMFHEVVNVRNWLDSKTLMEGIALGQVTPGPIVITATFIGYLTHGLPGAVVATIAIFSPSFLMLIMIMPFFDRMKASPSFQRAMKGILASFAGLLLFVLLKFAFAVHWDWLKSLLGLAAFAALLKKVDILYIVLTGTLLSLFFF